MNSTEVADKLIENLMRTNRKSYDMIASTLINGDQAEINKQCLAHPATFAFYAGLLATAKYQVHVVEHKMEQYFSEKYLEIKKEVGDSKGITETYIKQKINTDKTYQSYAENLFKLQQSEGILSALVKALEHKKDMLFSIASNMRAELKSGINVSESIDTQLAKTIRKEQN
jgi:hypothetical protein